MSKRYVGRVPPAEPAPTDGKVPRALPARRLVRSAGPGTVRGVAAPTAGTVVRRAAAPTRPAVVPVGAAPTEPAVVRGVAAPAVPPDSAAPVESPGRHGGAAPVKPAAVDEPADGATALLQLPDVTAAIFVDGSGRRGRLLRRTVYALVAFALLLILAFWLVQGMDAFGSTT